MYTQCTPLETEWAAEAFPARIGTLIVGYARKQYISSLNQIKKSVLGVRAVEQSKVNRISAPAMDTASLPASSSPTLQLVPATDPEFVQSSIMNAPSWKGPLNLDDYLEREAHLRKTDLNRHGGITAWILVDTVHPPSQKGTRRILASCETLRKRALVARKDGPPVETISRGIGSVYCPEAYRGRGYAQRMLIELAHILDTWQQREGEKGDFTVLWSDIGKVTSTEP